MATFHETAPGHAIDAIRLHLDGQWWWCAVTGWSPDGPTPAWQTPIEESGDGPALLVHGGAWGVRLCRLAGAPPMWTTRPPWSLEDAGQWGEPYVVCTPQTTTHAASAGLHDR